MIGNLGIHNGSDIVVLGNGNTLVKHIVTTFDQDKILSDNPQIFNAQRTGYPLLIHIISTIFPDTLQGKKILEIGGGILYGQGVLDSLTSKGALVLGMDKRNGETVPLSGPQWRGLWKYDWGELAKFEPESWNCIFNHRIGPNNGGYETITDGALKPGGYYLSFRKNQSMSPEPIDKTYLLSKGYKDFSFEFTFSGTGSMEDSGYQVTLLQKPLQTDTVIATTRSDIDAKL